MTETEAGRNTGAQPAPRSNGKPAHAADDPERRRNGADGVAVLGAVMGATAPQAVVAALLAAMADTGQDDGTAPSNSTTG